MMYTSALIVGAGSGLSASIARAFAKAGLKITLAARSTEKLADLAAEIGARTFSCDATNKTEVDSLFAKLDARAAPDVVVYNPSYRTRGPLIELDPVEVDKSIRISAFGGFLVAQAAVSRMLPAGPRRNFIHRCFSEYQGLCSIGSVCDGKIRVARLGAKPGARIVAKGNSHCALCN